VAVSSGDEVGQLASDFNRMASELDSRNRRLLETMSQLDLSRQAVTGERNFMANVLDSISSGILTFSPAGALVSVNTCGRSILGERVTEGGHFEQIFAHWPDLVQRIRSTVSGEAPFGRSPLRSGTGPDELCLDIGIFPIGSAMAQGITVTIRDETEKERMREEMTRLDRFASLGRLSAGIAHEIRNPLTGITLLLDDLHDRPAMAGECQEMMEKALAEIERVERLINGLLTYAAPPRTEFIRADLNLAVADSLLFFRKACEREGVILESSLPPLPLVTFDPEKIRQVLLNLLRNALSATPRGGVIAVATSLQPEGVVISVRDTGAGIPADALPLIFEPFFTRSSAGTGLGLSISQRIIEEHAGTISVTSEAGKGTLFAITLPLHQSERTDARDHGTDTDH
jgi:signal transduction histidine kinase